MLKLKLATSILIALIPQSINNYVVRHQEGLSIRFSKKSPPLAIFEDEQLRPSSLKQIAPFVSAAIPLRSGTIDLTKRALEIAHHFAFENREASVQEKIVAVGRQEVEEQVQEVVEKSVVQLSGMRIQKTNPNVMMFLKALPKAPKKAPEPQTIQTTPIETSHDVAEYSPDVSKDPYQQFEDIKKHYLKNEFLVGLTPAQRDRLEGVRNVDKILETDWSQPTFEEQAKEVLAQNTVIDKPVQVNIPSRASQTTRTNKQSEVNDTPELSNTADQGGMTVADNREGVVAQRTAEQKVPSLLDEPQLLISGSIEMAEGLAYLGNDQYIKVYRQAGTALLEEGNVVIKEGRYEIFVKNPQDGVVIAELRNIDQQILGRGEILLNEVIRKRKTREELKNIPLKIRPLASTTESITVSGYSFDDEQRIDGAKVSLNGFMDMGETDKKGKRQTPVLTDSSMVIKAEKQGFWGSMLFKTASQTFKHTLFGDETVRSWFEQLNLNSSKLKRTGIIWGEVKIGNTAVSDAEVEVVASTQILQPTYFVGGVIPDQSLKSTTSNGRFAIFDVEPGIYIVRARYKGKLFPPQVVVVDRGFVSAVALQWQEKSPSEIYVFDLESSDPVPSEIRFIGSDKKAYSQSGKHIVNFSGTEGVQVIEAQTQSSNHFVSRATVDKSNKQVMIPIISYGWINQVSSRVRINQNVDRGIIVGIARKSDMRIELDPLGSDDETDIVYFDSRGEVLLGVTSAPIGGGFVIFNAVPGVRTILMTYKGIKQAQIHTALSDPDVINVFNPNY